MSSSWKGDSKRFVVKRRRRGKRVWHVFWRESDMYALCGKELFRPMETERIYEALRAQDIDILRNYRMQEGLCERCLKRATEESKR